MRQLFSEHFEYTKEELAELWKSCVFIFDTNILLGLYRYSSETKSELLKTLDSIQERILLPSHVAKEFFNNRFVVINDQIKQIKETELAIQQLDKKLKENKAHPHIPKDLSESINDVFQKLKEHLDRSKTLLNGKFNNDEIKHELARIFNNKVSDDYTDDEIDTIISLGEDRLNTNNPPPGYMDYKTKIKKPEHATKQDKIRALGDFIIWNQIIKYAKDNNSSVIFITDDTKEDWLQKENGKTIGPRPELKKEFKEVSGQNIQMYTSFRFLELFNEHIKDNRNIKDDAISEIKEAYYTDIDVKNKKHKIHNYLNSDKNTSPFNIEHSKNKNYIEKVILEESLEDLEIQRDNINIGLIHLNDSIALCSPLNARRLKDLKRERVSMRASLASLKKNIEYIKKEIYILDPYQKIEKDSDISDSEVDN